MFKNVGFKIKKIVEIFFYLAAFLSVISGIVVWYLLAQASDGEGTVLGFFLFLIISGVGILTSWLSSLIIYAYGEIADKVTTIERKMGPDAPMTGYQGNTAYNNTAYDNTAYNNTAYNNSAYNNSDSGNPYKPQKVMHNPKYGRCDICGNNTGVVNTKFTDSSKNETMAMCYDCFNRYDTAIEVE